MFRQIINWIIDNKEWFFSGIGVTILTSIYALWRKKNTKKMKQKTNIKINQNSIGNKNAQIGIQKNYYGEKSNDK